MKAIVQRVKSASVTVDGKLISMIGRGLLVFAAIGRDDTPKEVEAMANKVVKFKLWDDDTGAKWKHNVQDVSGEILCVSQFTLLASTKKGNKPDFHKAADPHKGRELYDLFYTKMQSLHGSERVKNGVFQAMMDVGLVNDGPVTIEMDNSQASPKTASGTTTPATIATPLNNDQASAITDTAGDSNDTSNTGTR